MKSNKFLCVLVFVMSHFVMSAQSDLDLQTTEIIYVKAYKNFKSQTAAKPKPLENLTYQLLFDKSQALFSQSHKMLIDGDYKNKRLASKGGGLGVYYKNLDKEKSINVIEQDGQKYFVEKKFDQWNWEILDETKNILGYKCYKAMGKMQQYNYVLKENRTLKVTAWFTTQIPVSFGPSGFDGLPGLVLESQRGSFYFIAEEINFNVDKKINFKSDGVQILDEDFAKMQYKAFMNYTGN